MTKTTKTATTQKKYIHLEDALNMHTDLDKGQMWIKCGKFGVAGFDIKLDGTETLSDFAKCIELRGVSIAVANNEKGYPTLFICGKGEDLPF